MSAPAGPPPRVQIPRWIQLVGLPIGVFFGWVFGQAAGHTVFLFLVAALIALLLDPIVLDARGIQGAPRYRGGARVPDLRSGDHRHPRRGRDGRRQPDEDRGLAGSTTISPSSTDRARPTRTSTGSSTGSTPTICRASRSSRAATGSCCASSKRDVGRYTHRIVNFVEGAAISIGRALFDFVLVLVVSIYMLLDMQRLSRAVDRRFPPQGGRPLISRMEHALVSYVRGQVALSSDHRHERGARDVDPRRDRARARGGLLRPALRRLGRDHRGASLPGPMARRDPGGDLRRSSSIRSRSSGSCSCSSASTRSRATSSSRR